MVSIINNNITKFIMVIMVIIIIIVEVLCHRMELDDFIFKWWTCLRASQMLALKGA